MMGIISLIEKERKASVKAFLIAFTLPVLFILIGSINFPFQPIIALILFPSIVIIILLFIIPLSPKHKIKNDIPSLRFDERDTMFARARLTPDSKIYNEYYKNNPEKEKRDNKFRSLPGLLSPGTTYYDKLLFSSVDSTFTAVHSLRRLITGPVNKVKAETNPEKISKYIKNWAKHLGALEVGITELQDYHLYSHKGGGDDYGQPIKKEHKYAIAFTVEMDRQMNRTAPYSPTAIETAKEYFIIGSIAVQVASLIRELGYPARAHIDGDYQVICPLVARDAGLGEIGRMGLLMTPKQGPRVRIAVVTTDLPLIVDKRTYDHSMIEFCELCKKCATTCPGKAIPFDNRKDHEGATRWQINQDNCFLYWCACGTDCGRCMSVCPYSHPDNLMHDMVRFGIKNSYMFRRIAAPLDDIFYGAKPKPIDVPDWMQSVLEEEKIKTKC